METPIFSKPSSRCILLISFYNKTKCIRRYIAILVGSNTSLICSCRTRAYI
nr:MAG TPA: hypothetical protein [Caudoviricetes sp.]